MAFVSFSGMPQKQKTYGQLMVEAALEKLREKPSISSPPKSASVSTPEKIRTAQWIRDSPFKVYDFNSQSVIIRTEQPSFQNDVGHDAAAREGLGSLGVGHDAAASERLGSSGVGHDAAAREGLVSSGVGHDATACEGLGSLGVGHDAAASEGLVSSGVGHDAPAREGLGSLGVGHDAAASEGLVLNNIAARWTGQSSLSYRMTHSNLRCCPDVAAPPQPHPLSRHFCTALPSPFNDENSTTFKI
jgi:hypothetical protein